MQIKYMPNEKTIQDAITVDDPLLMLISHDGDFVIIGNIDVYGEHLILLKHAGLNENELDEFFRVIVDNAGADWTFVAPINYKNIPNREKRIETFYKDGITVISGVLKEMNYNAELNIPKRYRRHLDIFNEWVIYLQGGLSITK